jgi:hypothetical protein
MYIITIDLTGSNWIIKNFLALNCWKRHVDKRSIHKLQGLFNLESNADLMYYVGKL